MPSLTKKIIRGRPYYYLRESQRVNGKPKVVSTIYVGSAENIRDRLLRPQPVEVDFQEFGGSAAAFSVAETLNVIATIDRHLPNAATKVLPSATISSWPLSTAVLHLPAKPRSPLGMRTRFCVAYYR